MSIRIEISQKTLDSTIIPLLGSMLTRLTDAALQLMRSSQGTAAPENAGPSSTQALMASLAGLPPTTPLKLSVFLVAHTSLDRIVEHGRKHADLFPVEELSAAGSALVGALTETLLQADSAIDAQTAAEAAEKICAAIQVWHKENTRQGASPEPLASVLATLTKLPLDTPISDLVRAFIAAPVSFLQENGKGKWGSDDWKQAVDTAKDELTRLYPDCSYQSEVVCMLQALYATAKES